MAIPSKGGASVRERLTRAPKKKPMRTHMNVAVSVIREKTATHAVENHTTPTAVISDPKATTSKSG